MKLAPLLELTFTYSVLEEAGPIVGEAGTESQLWALAEGAVRGDRINGKHRSCNHPRRRADNVNVPDVHGLIETDDGAKIYYQYRGYGLVHQGTRGTIGSAWFRTGDPRYDWLNTVIAAGEGVFHDGSAPIRLYECIAGWQEDPAGS